MTLVEIMVSFGIFALLASAVMAGLVQSNKISLSNLSQSYAQAVAQSVVEEVVRTSPTLLADSAESSINIKVAQLTSSNSTSIEDFSLPWAANDTTFTSIGTTSKGILTDAAYVASSNTIRPERFMKMNLNLRRDVENSSNRIRITLRYQWEVPDRRKRDGTPLYLSGEIRTVRSTALRF